jgi:PAS domain S-box-containing protein
MALSGWGQRLEEWSVAALGTTFLVAAGRYVPPEGMLTGLPLAQLAVPVVVGVGLVIGCLWLQRVHTPRRILGIALWTAGGAIVGVAVGFWLVFAIFPPRSPIAAPAVLHLNGAAVMAAAGTVLGYYVTGARRREQQLATSRARFRALTENSPFVVVTIDETGSIRYTNDAVTELFGYRSDELAGESLTKLVPDWSGDVHLRSGDWYATSGWERATWSPPEYTAVDASGEEVPVEVSFGEYAAADDHLFTGVIQDITARKEAEERLETQISKVTRLHEVAAAIARGDAKETIFQRTAEGALELFPCDFACVAAMEGERFVPEAGAWGERPRTDEMPPIQTWYARASYESAQTVRVGYLHTSRWRSETRSHPASDAESPLSPPGGDTTLDDEQVFRSLMSVPIHGQGVLQLFAFETEAFTEGHEEVANMLATHVDTACERVEAEATIRRERDRLDEFAGVLSHDIRNPLTVAQGQLGLARNAEDPDTHLDAVEQAHDRIGRLIDDVLTLARQGESVGETENVSLDAVARHSWNSVETDDATLQMDSLGEIRADRSRLGQVFENLFRNAIEHGGTDVTVTVGRMDRGFYVMDTGPGLPPGGRDEVFESGYSTSSDGTGFGLAIVERIVEAHGWRIEATGGDEGGTRFEITGVEWVGL